MELDDGGGSGMGTVGATGLGTGPDPRGYAFEGDKERVTLSQQVIAIAQERARQESLKASGKFRHTCGDEGIGQGLSPGLQTLLISLVGSIRTTGDLMARRLCEAISAEHAPGTEPGTPVQAAISPATWDDIACLAVLMEEVGEAAREIQGLMQPVYNVGSLPETAEIEAAERGRRRLLRTELVQSAAVLLGWLERLDQAA